MNPLAVGILSLFVIGVVVQTIGRMRGSPNVPIFFWVMLALSMTAPLITGWMVLNKGEVLQSATVAQEKDHAQLEVPEGYALLVTADLNPEDGTEEDAYRTSYTFRVAGDKWKQKISGEMTKPNQSRQKLNGVQGESISESGKKSTNSTGQHVQDRFVLVGAGDVDIFVENYSGTGATSLLIEVTQAPPKPLWVWGFAVFASIMGIYFEVWKKCDQVAGDLSGLAFYAVFLADGITPTASEWDVAFAFAPGFFMGWGVVTGLAYLVKKVRGQ